MKRKEKYNDGLYEGIRLMCGLIRRLHRDGRDKMILKMTADTELVALLLQKYELADEDELEYLSRKADEEWDQKHDASSSEQIRSFLSSASGDDSLYTITQADIDEAGSVDPEQMRRIRLLEKLSDECEDELYNEVIMGNDEELIQKLMQKYHIN